MTWPFVAFSRKQALPDFEPFCSKRFSVAAFLRTDSTPFTRLAFALQPSPTSTTGPFAAFRW